LVSKSNKDDEKD